jgi:hypothetical protein
MQTAYSVAKQSKKDTEGPASKPSKRTKAKASNPARSAKEVRQFAEEFMKWAATCHAQMVESSYRMEMFDPDFRVKFVTSMVEKYMKQIDQRVRGQFDKKLADAMGKERARRMIKEFARKAYNTE